MILNRVLLAAAALSFTGCTALYDYELPAETLGCTTNDDCSTAGQICNSGGFCITPAEMPASLRVGYLFPGSVGDYGWVKSHDDGRRAVEAMLGNVTTTFVPNVFTGEHVQTAVPMLLEDGVNVIIGASSGHVATLQRLAKDYPEVRFLLSAGFVSDTNLGSYFGRMYQAKWLAGRLAGQMTETNRIGYIGSVPSPQTVRHINAFVEGVRSVNPEAVVMIEWLNSFLDPPTEELRSEQLLALDVDVLHGSTNAPSAVQVADGRMTSEGLPVYSIGYNNPNICELFGPESCIASAYWNWAPLVSRQLSAILEGSWDPTEKPWEGIKANPEESTVALTSPSTDLVSIGIRLDVESFVGKFAAGDMDAFDAVRRDNKGGSRRISSDADLLEMCWFVPGVVAPGAPPFMAATVPNDCDGAR